MLKKIIKNSLVFYILSLFFNIGLNAENIKEFGSTEYWLKDATTIQIVDDSSRISFTGLRFLIEPKFGNQVSNDDRNPIEQNTFGNGGFGIESNILYGWIAIQGFVLSNAQIQFSPEADMRKNGITKSPEGKVNTDFGFALGLSFFNGMVSTGYSYAKISTTNYFDGSQNIKKDIGIWYLNIQPVSVLKNLFQQIKK